MEPLPNEAPRRRGPPLGEKLVVGCGLFILLVVLFIAAMALAFQRACSCATHVVVKQAHVVHVPGNLDVTLLAHHYSRGTSLARPKPGLEFLITLWKLHNPGKSPRRIESFIAVSGLHSLGPERSSPALRDPLPQGTVAPGWNAVGWLVFQIEPHASIAEISYRSRSFVATWQFPR
jgi:hypothetical protein